VAFIIRPVDSMRTGVQPTDQGASTRVSTATKLSVAGGATVLFLSAGLVASAAVATGDVRSAAPVTALPAGQTVGAAAPVAAPPVAVAAAPPAEPAVQPAPAVVAAAPTPATTPVVLPAAPPPADPASLPSLTWGDSGSAVQTLQVRLNALGFRTPTSEGDFDDGTWSAVLAFQKFEGLERTGDVTPEVWQHLYQPQGWLPPSQPATVPKVEVDLDRQVLFLLNVERPGQVVIMNTSTGGGYSYTTKDGSTGYAFTPEGDFSVYYTYDGTEVAPLGTLYRPMYFYGGWAVHGSPSVPEYPASHGCVRLSNDDMDWLFDRAPSALAVTVRATMDPASLAQDG
jgi:hypothetical protein